MTDYPHQVVPPARRFRFGPFEADSRAGELRKHGIKVRMGQQTFQILWMLLEHPDEVVLREDLRMKLWPHNTVVEFDHSINAAIQKLRSALGETAEQPKYIETLPRRGYRFMESVEVVPTAAVAPPLLAPNPKAAPPVPPPAVPDGRRARFLWGIATATVLLAVLTLAFTRPGAVRAPMRSVSFSLSGVGRQGTVSPDGSAIAYRTASGLVLRHLNSVAEALVYQNDPLYSPASWSLDGSQVVFEARAGLVRLPMPNGPPTVLASLRYHTRGSATARDGSVIVAMDDLYQVSSGGGDPSKLDVPGLGDAGIFYWPEFLPDGKNILFAWAAHGEGDVGLYLATLEAGKFARRPIVLRRNVTAGHYSAVDGGKLLFVQNNKLYAQSLSVTHAKLEGSPEPVLDGVQSAPIAHLADFSVSQNGVLVWRAGTDGLAQPTWFDRTGKVLGTTGALCLPDSVKLSPDEKRVLLRVVAHDSGYGIAESNLNGFVPLSGITDSPLWMPRTSHVMYCRKEQGSYRLFERAAEGGDEKALRPWAGAGGLIDVSPDEKTLLYHEGNRLYSLRLDDPSSAPQYLANAVQARFSPNGRWIAYQQAIGKSSEVLVRPFPAGGLPTQLTQNGGTNPVWRGDGQEIFYRQGSKIYAVKVHVSGGSFSAGPPAALFDVRIPSGMVGDSTPMDVSRDGSRILFAQGTDKAESQITYVTTDWTSLRRR